ncbi:MAG: hypothetical protein ACYS22_12980 [Planctomycetota bacterium]|jgi:hypothetical protein
MVDSNTWVPEGFVEGRHPMITEALGQNLERRGGPGTGPQRVTACVKEGKDDEARAWFAENPIWRAAKRLPNLYELQIMPEAIDELIARSDLFHWLDAGGRLTGDRIAEGSAPVTVRVVLSGENTKAVHAKVEELGGRNVGRGVHDMLALVAADKVAELLPLPDAAGIDITRS